MNEFHRISYFGIHEQTDLVELRILHCIIQDICVDTAENGSFKAAPHIRCLSGQRGSGAVKKSDSMDDQIAQLVAEAAPEVLGAQPDDMGSAKAKKTIKVKAKKVKKAKKVDPVKEAESGRRADITRDRAAWNDNTHTDSRSADSGWQSMSLETHRKDVLSRAYMHSVQIDILFTIPSFSVRESDTTHDAINVFWTYG